jgi:hypothetical protein
MNHITFDSISQLSVWVFKGSLVIIFRISKFFGPSITEETSFVEKRIWCIRIVSYKFYIDHKVLHSLNTGFNGRLTTTLGAFGVDVAGL